MKQVLLSLMAGITMSLLLATKLHAQDVSTFRLIPFPKEIHMGKGNFALERSLVLEAPIESATLLGQLIGDDLERIKLPRAQVLPRNDLGYVLRWSAAAGGPRPQLTFRPDATDEDYTLQITPNAVIAEAPGSTGLFYAVQTLCQLIRTHTKDGRLPCMTIRDWPSIRWRAFQDDMTRGPSSTLQTMQCEVGLGAALKMNIFTYYMEYQYAFQKHPDIGPKDGSLMATELQSLVAYAKPYHVEIMGNQQSFGHFGRILRLPKYQHLREEGGTLCPVKQETYELLDDLYSEVVPLLPFNFFNVCCDETYGLGKGPSKDLADKVGVGGVYVQHIRRIYDLIVKKYGKRMMMWGDIILNHPEHLKAIPKDTIMLTWGYRPSASFENQIIPFAQSGYEFFVCPGVSCWNRILPDFGDALVNIRNFVRDGAKHGAIGVLNTAWDDDGCTFNAPNWHGYAWGAECAWNASSTDPADFNRRIGAVLFGEKGDQFGQAIELLSQTFRLPGMDRMFNKRFWTIDLTLPEPDDRKKAQNLLAIVRQALKHLKSCQTQATVNADLLDYFLFGAKRIELIGQRMLDHLDAISAYEAACKLPVADADAKLAEAEQTIRKLQAAHESLGNQFAELWVRENKPYALDWTLRKFQNVADTYKHIAAKIATARQNVETVQTLPSLVEVGLLQIESKQ